MMKPNHFTSVSENDHDSSINTSSFVIVDEEDPTIGMDGADTTTTEVGQKFVNTTTSFHDTTNPKNDNDDESVVTSTTERGHSLPNIEGLKVESALSSQSNIGRDGKHFRWKNSNYFLGGFAITIIVIVAVSVGFYFGRHNNNNNNNNIGTTSATVTEDLTNISNMEPPSANISSNEEPVHNTKIDISPPPNLFNFTERFQEIVYLVGVKQRISDSSVMEKEDTPQYKAVLFLANDDVKMYPIIPRFDGHTEVIDSFIERYIMLVFYYSLSGSNWLLTYNFLNTDFSVCDWNDDIVFEDQDFTVGVTCDMSTKLITSIFMPSNNLQGTIPSEIGYLLELEELSLYDNKIQDIIEPETVMNWNETLYALQLGANQFSGNLPVWIGELDSLEYLGLNNNNFSGSIPYDSTQLWNLKELDLSNNQLTGLLDFVDSMNCPRNLTLVYVQHNKFSANLHDGSFAYCDRLEEIDLSYNNITGEIYSNFYTQFISFNAQHNNLSGMIKNVSSMEYPTIEYFNVADNLLTGPIPSSISNLKELLYLDVGNNQLSGSLSDAFDTDHIFSFRYVLLNDNNFTEGPIPNGLQFAENLTALVLSNSNRNGPIPTWIGTLSRLHILDLHSNKFSSTIPAELGNLPSLKYLMLNRNNLNGIIPSTLSYLKDSLSTLYLDKNDLTGLLPVCAAPGDTSSKAQSENFPPSNDNRVFTADCNSLSSSKVECDCCDSCCADQDNDCNNPNDSTKNLREVISEYTYLIAVDQNGFLRAESYLSEIMSQNYE